MEGSLKPGLRNAGIEHRNLQALGIGCVLFMLVGLSALKITAVIYRATGRFNA